MLNKIIKDDFGNSLEIDSQGNIGLRTKWQKRVRNIGKLFTEVVEGDTKIVRYRKMVKNNHVMRWNDSWGLNHQVLTLLNPETVVRVIHSDDNKVYELTQQEVMDAGVFGFYKKQGFELQLFVPRNSWRTRAFINAGS
jgi:hypothetical protein